MIFIKMKMKASPSSEDESAKDFQLQTLYIIIIRLSTFYCSLNPVRYFWLLLMLELYFYYSVDVSRDVTALKWRFLIGQSRHVLMPECIQLD